MSSAEDLIERINKILKAVEEVDSEFGNAIDEAHDAIDKAEALGHTVAIESFTSVKDVLEDLRKPLGELESDIEKVRKTVEEFGDDT
jgi:vacuolar-type H+-ATPase subunit D/Vma8